MSKRKKMKNVIKSKVKKSTNLRNKKIKKKIKKISSFARKEKGIILSSGSKSLDKLLGGGILYGTSFLILGSPHSGKKPIIMKMAKNNCGKYGKIIPVLILTDIGADNWIDMAKKNGWYPTKKNCQIFYIDGYSQQFNVCSSLQNVKCLEVPFTLSNLSISVSDFISNIKAEGKKPLVILHSISTLIETFGENEVYSFLQFFLGKLKMEGITVVSTMQLGVHGEDIETNISSLYDCVVVMRDGALRASGYVSIKDKKWHNYKFVKNELVLDQ